MVQTTGDKILASAQRFSDLLPKLMGEEPFLKGEWHSAEALNVQLRTLEGDLQCFDIFNDPSPEADKRLRDQAMPIVQAAKQALDSQDRLSGIDARQVLPDKRSRTWSLRGWDI